MINFNLKLLITVVLMFVTSHLSIAGEKQKVMHKGENAPVIAVPIEQVLPERAEKEPMLFIDKQGRTIFIDNGVFKLPESTGVEIVELGKKRKGGGGTIPTAPKPSCAFPVGPCTESNWTQSCGNGGTQECKQWSCGCSGDEGLYYVTGSAACGTCTSGGTGGGLGDPGETQTPDGW